MVVSVLSQFKGLQIFGPGGMLRRGQGFTVDCHLEGWKKAGAEYELFGCLGGEPRTPIGIEFDTR